MEASEWIALVAVFVSPAAALAGAYVNSHLASRNRRAESADAARSEALQGVARMHSLLLDAVPSLVLTNDLREYASPDAAVRGLYGRWLELREPLVLLSLTHPSPEVREAAFAFQAEVEMSLRTTSDAASNEAERDHAEEMYRRAGETALRLGQLLSPFDARHHLALRRA